MLLISAKVKTFGSGALGDPEFLYVRTRIVSRLFNIAQLLGAGDLVVEHDVEK
jgi:hypothetical protein